MISNEQSERRESLSVRKNLRNKTNTFGSGERQQTNLRERREPAGRRPKTTILTTVSATDNTEGYLMTVTLSYPSVVALVPRVIEMWDAG